MRELLGHRDRLNIIEGEGENCSQNGWLKNKKNKNKKKECSINLDKVAGRTDKLKKFWFFFLPLDFPRLLISLTCALAQSVPTSAHRRAKKINWKI